MRRCGAVRGWLPRVDGTGDGLASALASEALGRCQDYDREEEVVEVGICLVWVTVEGGEVSDGVGFGLDHEEGEPRFGGAQGISVRLKSALVTGFVGSIKD